MTCTSRTIPCPAAQPNPGAPFAQWRQARLTEARSILSEAADHSVTLVTLAALVVADQSDDDAERARAHHLLGLRGSNPLHATTTVAFQQGGAA